MSEQALVKAESSGQLSVQQVQGRLKAIEELMRSAMVDGLDYGKIPGTAGKPTLLKPGAEKLSVMFQLDAQFQTVETWHDDGHLTAKTYCTIYHAPTQARLGGASAICSTREAKYGYRKGERTCPACGQATVLKSSRPGEGYFCWRKKGGCGANFAANAPEIVGQQTGRVANPDLADCYNTVLRMSEKRGMVAAIRQVTGASAIFDEELPESETVPGGHPPADEPPARTAPARPPKHEPPPAHVEPDREPGDEAELASPAQLDRIEWLLSQTCKDVPAGRIIARLVKRFGDHVSDLADLTAEQAVTLEGELEAAFRRMGRAEEIPV